MEPGAELGPPRPPRTCAPRTSADVDTGCLHCHDIWARGMSRSTGDNTKARKHLQNSPPAQRASRGGATQERGPGGAAETGRGAQPLGPRAPSVHLGSRPPGWFSEAQVWPCLLLRPQLLRAQPRDRAGPLGAPPKDSLPPKKPKNVVKNN